MIDNSFYFKKSNTLIIMDDENIEIFLSKKSKYTLYPLFEENYRYERNLFPNIVRIAKQIFPQSNIFYDDQNIIFTYNDKIIYFFFKKRNGGINGNDKCSITEYETNILTIEYAFFDNIYRDTDKDIIQKLKNQLKKYRKQQIHQCDDSL